jgi:hypothetical protein
LLLWCFGCDVLVLDGLVGLVCESASGCRDHENPVRAQVGDDLVGVAVGRQSPFPMINKTTNIEKEYLNE